LPDIAAGLNIFEFARKLYVRLKKRRKKSKRPRKTTKGGVSRKQITALAQPRRLSKDEELAQKLLTNPSQALKEMTAEYLVKNRRRIIRDIEDYLVDEFG